MRLAMLLGLLFIVSVQFVDCDLNTSDLPSFLKQCFYALKKKCNDDLALTAGGGIFSYCYNYYSWVFQKDLNIGRNVTADMRNWVFSYAQPAIDRVHLHRRKKRQAEAAGAGGGQGAGWNGPPGRKKKIVRKEIRLMSQHEINIFFAAMEALRSNTTVAPNKYEAIAAFHDGITSVSAHGGCNFFPWHRMYLTTFENAVRDEDPRFKDFAVPYWDTRLEARMDDPTQSCLFSNRLMGSCSGVATGGIMGRRGWNSTLAGEVIRNCNEDGPLITSEMIYNVTRQTHMRDICGEDSSIYNDGEYNHNGPHRWVDGHMASLPTSTHDPLFWLLHCFVDYIWEVFRQNQRRHGVDPETDWAQNPVVMGAEEMHRIDADLGFGAMKVGDALSNVFTEELYEYAPPPSCTPGEVDCNGSKYIKCVERGQGVAECVARTCAEVREREEELKPKPKPCPKPKPKTKPDVGEKPKPKSPVVNPHQNNFCLNGKHDSNQWVYVPIKVIYRRAPEYKSHGSYPVHNGVVEKTNDLFAPQSYSNIYRYLRQAPKVPAPYENCLAADSPTTTIYVKSVGMNYEGTFKEMAVIDQRMAVTVSMTYVAVKNPISGQSIAMLQAQDVCGRVCRPICKVAGSSVFRPCSGVIRLTTSLPRQYGNTFGDAVLDVWDFSADKACPQLQADNIVVSFYCDYKTDWIWPVEPPVKQPKLPVVTPPTALKKKTTVVPGCSLGYECSVSKPCNELSNCRTGETEMCVQSCHKFVRCLNGKFYIHACRRGMRLSHQTGRCVPGICDYKTSGIHRVTGGKPRRGGRQRGRGRGRARKMTPKRFINGK